MSFAKAAQNTNKEALGEFSLASMVYKQACARYTVIRRATVDMPTPSDEAIVAHHKALSIYKQACRDYREARSKWILSVQAAALKLPTISNEELYSTTMETNDRAITMQLRQEALLSTITPEEIEIQKNVLAARITARKSVKDNILSEKADDPTDGDFEPL